MKRPVSFCVQLIVALFFLAVTSNCLLAQNLLNNGDFESGGSGVGFLVHDYTLINPLNGVSNPGQYARTTNPVLMNSAYNSGGDHTTGEGSMLVIDGAISNNNFFWTTGNTGGAIGGFTAGTTYTFSYWIKSVSNQVTTDESTRANIGVFFINANNVNPAVLNNLAPLPAEGWKKVSYSFVATANNVMVRLRTINAGVLGNDFAVDDFSITEGALPFEGTYTITNPTCPTSTNGTITVSLSGGFLPYGAYTLSGAVSQVNTTGQFSGLAAGTYALSVTDANGQPYSQSAIVLSVENDLQLSNPTTICEGETTQLHVSGGVGTYTWTANPPDITITNPSNATQNVSPLVTTTYTVTSGFQSDPTNLVFNGDFTLGAIGFTTEHTQVDNPNPFGVQSSYAIVQNPNAWFTAFSSCGDHTTGTGNLMVVDGSTDPTGNIKVWCNEDLITVLPNTSYTFSYYVASVAPQNPAKLEVLINGVSLGVPQLAPAVTCLWTLHTFTWNSGAATTAAICIYNREFLEYGNDFALDDLSMVETLTCLYEKTVLVTVTPLDVPTFDAIDPSCVGSPLEPLPTTSLNNYTGSWSPELNNTITTTYTFTPSEGQCAASTALTIEINPAPLFTISQGCVGSNYTLSAVVASTGTDISYVWYDSLNQPIGGNSTLVISTGGSYRLVVTQQGCSEEETINVLQAGCRIQKGISPNNDGMNDSFDLTSYNVTNLEVFNRYGVKVYNKSNYMNEWYGQSTNGNELPDGTYYFVINFDDLDTKTGWIYINR